MAGCGLGLPILLDRAPRIERPEAPDVAFEVAAGVSLAAPVAGVDVEDEFGAGFQGPRLVCERIRHEHITGLGFAVVRLRRLHHVRVEGRAADRAQHDHAVAAGELGVADGAVRILDQAVLFETEGTAQPGGRGAHVLVAQGRHDAAQPALETRYSLRLHDDTRPRTHSEPWKTLHPGLVNNPFKLDRILHTCAQLAAASR